VACFVIVLFSHSVPLHTGWGRMVLDVCSAYMGHEMFLLYTLLGSSHVSCQELVILG